MSWQGSDQEGEVNPLIGRGGSYSVEAYNHSSLAGTQPTEVLVCPNTCRCTPLRSRQGNYRKKQLAEPDVIP